MNYNKLDSAALLHRMNNPDSDDNVEEIKAVLKKRNKLPSDSTEKKVTKEKVIKEPKEKVAKQPKEKVIKEPKEKATPRGKFLSLAAIPNDAIENNIGKEVSVKEGESILKGIVTKIYYYANKPNLVYYMVKIGEDKPKMFSVNKVQW